MITLIFMLAVRFLGKKDDSLFSDGAPIIMLFALATAIFDGVVIYETVKEILS